MPEPTETTGQPENGTQASSTAQPVTPAQETGEMVPKARLDGALAKIQELTLANRALAEQIATKDIQLGDLTAKVTTLEAEKGQLVGQHTTALKELNDKYTDAQGQLAQKEALERKLSAIKTSGHPELLAIIDSLPVAEDDEKQLQVINNMAAFATDLVKKREAELLAGTTDGSSGIGAIHAKDKPTTSEGWQAYINSLPLGSKERQAAFDEWFAFANK
jgi:hypothetical protein